MKSVKLITILEVIGAIGGVASIVYLMIQIDYYRDRLSNMQVLANPPELIGSDISDVPSVPAWALAPAQASGRWHVAAFVVKTAHDPYQDLKLEYLLTLKLAESGAVTGIGEKIREADRDIRRENRSRITITSGEFKGETASFVFEEQNYQGKFSTGRYSIRFRNATSFVGYAESTVADTIQLVYGEKE